MAENTQYKHIGPKVTVSKQLDVKESILVGGSKSTPTGVADRATLYYDDTNQSLGLKVGTQTVSTFLKTSHPAVIKIQATHPRTLETQQSGSLIFLDHAAGAQIIIPDVVEDGCHYTFFVATKPTLATYQIHIHGDTPSSKIFGTIQAGDLDEESQATEHTGSSGKTAVYIGPNSTVGDRVDLYHVGGKWFVTCFAHKRNGILFTDPAQ